MGALEPGSASSLVSWTQGAPCSELDAGRPLLGSWMQGAHQFSSPVTFTTGCCFHFDYISVFSGAISPLISSSKLGTYYLQSSSFSVVSFCRFILFMGFSRQEY